VVGQLLIGGVEIRLIAAGLGDTALEVVGDDQLRHSAEVLEATGVTHHPLLQALAPGRLGVGVVGSAEYGHEDLGLAQFTGVGVDHRQGRPTVVDKQLLTGLVVLAHRGFLPLQPLLVEAAVMVVAVVAFGMALGVLLPQKLQGHDLGLKLLINHGPIGHCSVLRLYPGAQKGVGEGRIGPALILRPAGDAVTRTGFSPARMCGIARPLLTL
jgi:hypothetical protein